MVEFRDLGVSERTLRGLATMGFEAPTPVQERAIPRLLEGGDVTCANARFPGGMDLTSRQFCRIVGRRSA